MFENSREVSESSQTMSFKISHLDSVTNQSKNKVQAVLSVGIFSYDNLKEIICYNLGIFWISTLHELQVYGLNRFKRDFSENGYLEYFFQRKYNKNIAHISTYELLEFWEKIWLPELKKVEQKLLIQKILKENGIENLWDILEYRVREFRNIVENNLLLKHYFLQRGLQKSFIKKHDIIQFWENIWLQNKRLSFEEKIKKFKIENSIFTYADISEERVKTMRQFLWENEISREILQELWLKKLQDFREEHLKRFARRIWLEGIPEDFKFDEKKSAQIILNRLKQSWIECKYGLLLNGLKWFKRIFKEKYIGTKLYREVNAFVIHYTHTTVVNLKQESLEKIVDALWLPNLTLDDHKLWLISDLWGEKYLATLSKTQVKSGWWHNVHIRYFLSELQWITDVKKLRPEHINKMRYDIYGV